MNAQPPRINALVTLLNHYCPSELEDLRKRYPAQRDLLQIGTLLGTDDPDVTVRIDTSLRGLQAALICVEYNIPRLRMRLARAKNLRLVGQITATITSVGLVAVVAAGVNTIATMVAAGINLIATLCALVAAHLETPLHGGKGNLVDFFEKLVKQEAEAKQLLMEFEICQGNSANTNDAMELVRRANALAADLSSTERLLWRKQQLGSEPNSSK